MSNQISVQFKVAGGDIDAYLQNIQKRSSVLGNEAIKAAIAQTEKGKELLNITNQHIRALEQKNKLEADAMRNMATRQRDELLIANRDKYADYRERLMKTGFSAESKAKRSQELTAEEKANELKIKSSYRDSISLISTEEKERKLQTNLAREQIETIKQTAQANVKAINAGDLKISDVIRRASTDEEKYISRLTEEGVKKDKSDFSKGGGQSSILGSLLTIDNLNKFVSTASQLAQTQNGFDQIGNSGRALSTIVGTALGGIIGSLIEPGGGTILGANIGGSLGNLLGGTSSDFLQRTAIAKQEFLKASYRYGALTGNEPGAFEDTAGIGVNVSQFLQTQYEFAKRRGNSSSSRKTTLDALYLEHGFGVDQGTSAGLVELQRSAKESNRDLANLIGGVLQKGANTYFKNGDTTFLGEFLQRFTTLQKELLKTNPTVGTAATYSILERFNSLGGGFSTSDSRSGGLINTINNSLANPNTDFKKALSFYALKKNNPNMSLADLIEEQQKGLGSSNYLNSMMSLVDGMGGDENYKRINFAGFLGLQDKQAFASQIYNGYKSGKFKGAFSSGELSGLYDFKSRADSNTNVLDKDAANIYNNLLGPLTGAVEEIGKSLVIAFQESLSGAVIELENGKLILPVSRVTIQKNATTAAAERARLNAIPTWQMQNHLDAARNGGAHHK